MLRIRQEQMDDFARLGRIRFEAKMVRHLCASFPVWSGVQSEDHLLAFVRLGMERAAVHGLRTELEVARYINVMQALAPHFDTMPRFDWARRILEEEKRSATERLDRLADAVEYFRQAELIQHVIERRTSASPR